MTAILIAVMLSLTIGAIAYFIADSVWIRRQGGYAAVKAAQLVDGPQRRPNWATRFLTKYTGLRIELAVAVAVAAWLVTLLGLQVIFPSEWVAILVSFPLALATGYGVLRAQAARRKAAFEAQFVRMIERLSTQISKGGQSLPDAIRRLTIAQPEEPIASELRSLLRDLEANVPPSRTASEIHARYNSEATHLFWLALVVNDEMGGVKITNLLQDLAADLKAELELRREALTELSQDKFEGYMMVVLAVLIVGVLLATFRDVVGVMWNQTFFKIVFAMFAANFAFGLYRLRRLLSRVSRGEF